MFKEMSEKCQKLVEKINGKNFRGSIGSHITEAVALSNGFGNNC